MQNIYETFEFNKIKNKISEYSKTEIGRLYIDELILLESKSEVMNALLDLKEMQSINIRFGLFPISGSANAINLIEIAKKTALLTPRDLSLIAEDVLTSQNIIKFLNKIDVSYERIKDKTKNFCDLSNLEKEIHHVITNSLTINDKATPELYEIRKKLKNAEANLQQRIASIALTYSKYLNDDNATIRNGHLVLPVKTADKSKVFGIVHDVSDTGATTFIEPMEIVELNNQITSLKIEESEECRKILKQLTALCLLQENEIVQNNQIIGEIDFIQAKSQYAQEIDGEIATISDEKIITLKNAKHPLIDPNKVISNSYYFDKEKRIIIISGPNAGGKTVSLKTVGLLVLMTECGLAIPADEAIISYIKNIYIDIGDNQSLSDNLSTFSGHMNHIGEILNKVTNNDLVLIDELGTGTDPKEGEALALAVVKYFEKKNVLAMISSHFEALKEYAFLSPNITNSSMLFDEQKLLPTYIFKQDTAGKSYALDVASRYGISENIINEAKNYLANNSSNDVNKLLSILSSKVEQNTKLEKELDLKNKQLTEKEKQLRIKEENIENRREHLLEDVKDTREEMIEEAKKEIDAIIKQLNGGNIKLHEAIALKKQIDDLNQNEIIASFNEEIKLDDYVSVPTLGINGRVVRLKDKKAHIIGDNGMAFDVEIENLHKIAAPKNNSKPIRSHGYDNLINSDLGLELKIIGYRRDEAKEALIKYLDSCRVKHFSTVRIIHGFGNGILRNMVHEYLKTQNDLTYRSGNMNEGGSGATVVNFKK